MCIVQRHYSVGGCFALTDFPTAYRNSLLYFAMRGRGLLRRSTYCHSHNRSYKRLRSARGFPMNSWFSETAPKSAIKIQETHFLHMPRSMVVKKVSITNALSGTPRQYSRKSIHALISVQASFMQQWYV
jgi:hypothetical protein